MPNQPSLEGSPERLTALHDAALEQLRYQHTDVWRAQQFYTTLNTAIVSIALSLLKLGTELARFDSVPLLVIGGVVSVFGFVTVRRLRRFYLNSLANVVEIEAVSGIRKIVLPTGEERNLGMEWAIKDDQVAVILANKETWVRCNVWRWWSVASLFMFLQLMFLVVDATIVGLIFAGYF